MTMKKSFESLLGTDFLPLAEVKAKLSEKLRGLSQGKRLAITNNGRPTAVLISYPDYLELLRQLSSSRGKAPVLTLEDWKRDKKKRRKIRNSITRHFDASQLPRKGQKTYKRDTLKKFE